MSGNIILYVSSATSSLKIKKDITNLKFLLEKKKIQYEERDMAQMSKEDRDPVYESAGTRTLPMCFVNGKYVGDYDELQQAEECEELDDILKGGN